MNKSSGSKLMSLLSVQAKGPSLICKCYLNADIGHGKEAPLNSLNDKFV